MIDVKRPRLLDNTLHETAVLYPLGLQLNLQTPGVSTAAMTLAPGDGTPAMHAWVALYNANGFVGYYRVTSPATDYTQQAVITLRHGIDCLADAVLAAQEEYNGTPAALLTRIMNAQTTLVNGVKPWTLGDCAATDNIKMQLNYPRLNDLLADIEEKLEGYIIEYDQTVFPWVMHVHTKPATVDSEFRLNRNIMTISRTLNDNDLCTQLILSINSKVTSGSGSRTVTTTNTYIKTYDNAAAQAIWGIVQKTADIDTGDNLTVTTDAPVPSTPEADAWAAQFLADHAQPTVQIQISAQELKQITGDTWDEAKLGHMCRVAMPDYGETFTERVVSVNYPDALGQPDTVNVSLANQLPRFSSSIAMLRKETAGLARSGRSAGRAAANAQELEVWSQIVKYQEDALDGTGIIQLYESGIDMDAQGGVKIFSLAQGFQSNYAGIQVNNQAITAEVTRATAQEGILSTAISAEAGKISQIVSAIGSNGQVTAASVVLAINAAGDSIFSVNAGVIELNGSTVASSLQGEYVECDTLVADGIDCNGDIYADGDIRGATMTIGTSGTGVDVGGNAISSFGTATASGGTITIPTTTLDGSSGSSITFNVADTAYYQNHVGISSTGSWTWDSTDEVYYRTITARDGSDADIGLPTITTSVGNWVNNTCIVTVKGPGDHAITTATVTGQGGGSYEQGWDALVTAADSSSYVQYSGYNSVSSSLTKSNGTIDGYIWLKDYSGTWQRRRHLTVSYPNDTYNKSVTLTYKGSVNGVYTYTTSTYVSGLTTNSRYTVHFNA